MKKLFLLIIIAISLLAFKNDKPAYQIFTAEGKAIKYSKMMEKLSDSQVIFFGELHNNAIAHWLQLELTRDMHKAKEGKLILGAEMFEADNQLLMDEYLSGLISQKKFEEEARLWNNYKTDYKPLVEFANENKLRFIATNIPRRYASRVFSEGFEGLESLSDEAKRYFAPLPVDYDPELDCYKNMLSMGGGMGGHTNENFPKAQAIKDATMAHFIHTNMIDENLFIHYNGSYHSDNHEGIVWYLKRYNESVNISTISVVNQSQLDSLSTENQLIADYIIVVDEDMTTTY